MAVKRRRDAASSAGSLRSWLIVFKSGYDFLGEVAKLGIATDAEGRPPRAATKAAWDSFGPEFLSLCGADLKEPCWAEKEFGPPAKTSGRSKKRERSAGADAFLGPKG